MTCPREKIKRYRKAWRLHADRGAVVFREDVEKYDPSIVDHCAKLITRDHQNGVRIPRSLRWLIRRDDT